MDENKPSDEERTKTRRERRAHLLEQLKGQVAHARCLELPAPETEAESVCPWCHSKYDEKNWVFRETPPTGGFLDFCVDRSITCQIICLRCGWMGTFVPLEKKAEEKKDE